MGLRSFALVCLLVLSGCLAAPINERNARVHADAGYAAMDAGNWDGAARQFAKAVVNADLADLPPRGRAVLTYEYGRALGAVCDFKEAEEWLNKAAALYTQAGALSSPAYAELGRLMLDQGKHEAAVGYFEKITWYYQGQDLAAGDPRVAMETYREWAAALDGAGRPGDADAKRSKANSLAEAAAKAPASPYRRTPYGKHCR